MITDRPVSLADQVFETIEWNILNGVYPRGSILTEAKLCEELGVSRTPVREAIRALEQEHIIESQNKGLLVLGITEEDAEYIYEIRKRIEGLAAAACAARITEDELKDLEETLELQEFYVSKHDAEKVKALDSEFHEKIYKLSGSAVFYDTLVPLHRKIQKFRKASIENKSRAMQSSAEHWSILKAIAAHDTEAADKEMALHVYRAQQFLREMLREKEKQTN